MSTYAIEIDGLTKSYDGNVHALNGVDIKIKEGEFFGLWGQMVLEKQLQLIS